MIEIDARSIQAGDIIFVYAPGKRAKINVIGQSLMRLREILRKEASKSRYSHVMLGISPGVVIHANGKSVKMERLNDAFHRDQIQTGNLQVMRLTDPPLGESDAMKIIKEAEIYLNQAYSFIPGRKSTSFGRLLHHKRRLTHPFCSELVAAAFAGIGRPITKRPPDRVLPLDLEVHCTPPAWQDVTRDYIAKPISDASIFPDIEVEGRVFTLPKFFEETDRLLNIHWGLQVELTTIQYDTVTSIVSPCALIQQLRSAELNMAKYLAINPQILFSSHLDITREDLRTLSVLYQDLRTGIFSNSTHFAEALSLVTVAVPHDKRAYEGIPSVEELRELEILGALLSFGARVLRLEAELGVIAVALQVPLKNSERFNGVTKERVAPLLGLINELKEHEMNELLAIIDSITMPKSYSYTNEVRRTIGNVVRFHAVLSILIYAQPGAAPERS